ncbi:hypothetical protein GJ496_011026 [Pomphorhynchus laevis]|nr:hypothetical protein GJ496_011026 [Pomphorhynchus laevis]
MLHCKCTRVSIVLLLVFGGLTCSELFYRGLLAYDRNDPNYKKYQFCWFTGTYFDLNSHSCNPFPMHLSPGDLVRFRDYTRSEIEMICWQLWLEYDDEYQMCVNRHKHPYWVTRSLTLYSSFDNKESHGIICPANLEFSLKHSLKLIDCLLIHGLAYDSKNNRCCIMNRYIGNSNLIQQFRTVLQSDMVTRRIWKNVCKQLGMIYVSELRHCVKSNPTNSNAIVYDIFTSMDFAKLYHPELSDYIYQIRCAVAGGLAVYIRSNQTRHCYYHDLMNLTVDYYQLHKSLIKQLKEIHCNHIGRVYQIHIDICITVDQADESARITSFPALYCPDCRFNDDSGNEQRNKSRNEGFNYFAEKNKCIYFSDNYEIRRKNALLLKYLPYIHGMIKSHCERHKLRYSRALRICVSKYNFDNMVDEEVIETNRSIDANKVEWPFTFNWCVEQGYDHDPIKNDCIKYPDKISDVTKFRRHTAAQFTHACKILFNADDITVLNRCLSTDPITENIKMSKYLNLLPLICEVQRKQYNDLIKVCVLKKNDKFLRNQKVFYEDLMELFCLVSGQRYNKNLDECVAVTFITFKHRKLIKTAQMKEMCRHNELEYDNELKLCIMRVPNYEKEMPPIPILPRNVLRFGNDICIRFGMDFDSTISILVIWTLLLDLITKV